MARGPGHDSGHAAPTGAPAGFSWEDYVAWLVAEHGSLAAVAQKVAHLATTTDDVASIERALRRLRRRANLDGGTGGDGCFTSSGSRGAWRRD